VKQGGTFTQLGGTLEAGRITLSGGTIEGTLRNRGFFNYVSGIFHGKLINERFATLSFNSGKLAATDASAGPQLEVEVSGTGSSLVTAGVNQDLRSLIVDYGNDGLQGFDLASNPANGEFRTIRIYPQDAAAVAQQSRELSGAIANALANPGDGIFDSGLQGMPGTRIGLAHRLDANQQPFLLMRPTVIGDVNLDGSVSIADFIDLATNFDTTDATWDTGDLNFDGSVTIADFIDLAANFGRSYSGEIAPITMDEQKLLQDFAANVPEVNSIAFLAIGAVLIGSRRKRISESAAAIFVSSGNQPTRPAM